MKGIIFDFNGTMFLDSHLHEQAWFEMIKRHTGKELTEEDILHNIHGRTNDKILRHFLSESLTDEEVLKLGTEKEQYYRDLCVAEDKLVLTDGLAETLDKIVDKGLPLTIATASEKENVAFYFDVFPLTRWFDFDKVVFHDGSFPGKPNPDIFLHAAEKLELQPEDCMVIEDAFSGLTAAKRANIGAVIAIDPFGENAAVFEEAGLSEDGLITDFHGFFESMIEPRLN